MQPVARERKVRELRTTLDAPQQVSAAVEQYSFYGSRDSVSPVC